MPPRSAHLPLDTKHPRENTKLLDSVGHTPGENPKIHIFLSGSQNERIKLTSSLTISYITFNTTSEYSSYYITAECNHLIRVYEQFNWTAEYKHVNRVTAELNIYLWHDEILIYKLRQQVIKLPFNETFGERYKQKLWSQRKWNPLWANPEESTYKVSSSLHLSPATGGNKTLSTQLYSARLT